MTMSCFVVTNIHVYIITTELSKLQTQLSSEADKQYINELIGQIDEYKAELKKRGVNVVNKNNFNFNHYPPSDPKLNPNYGQQHTPSTRTTTTNTHEMENMNDLSDNYTIVYSRTEVR